MAIVRFVDIVDNVDLSFRFIVVLFCLCFAVPGELAHHVHPAAMKLALRYHIQTLCRSPHCVNSLVLYMNSPAKNDGTMYLWDVDFNGLVSILYSFERFICGMCILTD